LILVLAPYFSGLDFGVIKIPAFNPDLQKRLKWIGPIIMLLIISIHIPFYNSDSESNSNDLTTVEDTTITKIQDEQNSDPIDTSVVRSDFIRDSSSNDLSNQINNQYKDNPEQNSVIAEIVEKVISGVPKQTTPIGNVSKFGETTLVGLVTVKAPAANFVPETYLLEWVLITPQGNSILLDSYRENETYKFTQRSDAMVTPYWVNKTIWADNIGVYEFRVYTSDFELVAAARLEIK
jgi:hypothetical protein